MKSIAELHGLTLQSSSSTTREFTQAYNTTKKLLTKILTNIGCKDLEFRKGHFSLSVFLTSQDGDIYYLSINDFRDNMESILVRTANSYKDFSGGSNNFIRFVDFENKIKNFIK